jgi:hypothetical protein
MAGFRIDSFQGMRPRISALKLKDGESQTASNVELGSGDLQPWLAPDTGVAVGNTFFNRTVYLFDNAGSPEWFEWDAFVSVARGAVKGDTLERIYFTGDGVPKMTYRTIAVTGSGPFPTAFRNLGIPQPSVPPTISGIELPESVAPDDRRTTPGSILTKAFEVVFVNWTTHPGTGTPDTQWNLISAWAGDIVFNLQIGDTIKILEVIDADTLRIGSATSTGALAVTAGNDTTDTSYYNSFDNNGSTQVADFTGWRLPDGVQVSIPGHKLRVGDVIEVTRLDQAGGLIFPAVPADDFFEQSWTAEADVTIDASTFKQSANARIGANADATLDFNPLLGGFYYDVNRPASVAGESENRSYVYTFVSVLGEEGPPSPVSETVNALDGDTILLTGLESPPTLNYQITHMRIYRTNSTVAGTELQFVKEIAVANTTTENVLQANLGEVLSSGSFDPPPATMQGITEMPNGMLVGFVGKTLHFCEPYFPHAWPAEYDQTVAYDIVALAGFGNSIAILTEGVPSIITASHPRNANARPYEINQACVSEESIATTTDSVIYASPDGLVEISINGAKIVTQGYMSKKEWDSYSPSTIVGEIHDGKYVGFFDGTDNVPQSPASVFLTGTVVTLGDTPGEADIVAGGRTLILTLVSDTWTVAAGSAFDNIRQDILDGITSSTDFTTGWNAQTQTVTDVVRTSDTVVTITLSALASYSVIANETISVLVPASAVVLATALPADVTWSVTALEDYSSAAIAFSTFDTGGTEIPVNVTAALDIIDWDTYQGVGTGSVDQAEFTAAAFSPSLNRWLAVGFADPGATKNPGTAVFSTSDDNGLTWTQRNSATPDATNKKPRTAVWYKEYAIFAVGGDNGSIQISPDGITWEAASIEAVVPATVSLRDLVIASGATSPYLYAGCSSADFLLRSPDLDLNPASYTWNASTVAYTSATGTKLMASGGGRVVSVGNFDTDMELSYTIHGNLTHTLIGAVSTYNATGLVYGDDTWVAVSDDFRIVTCASGDEGTIGNWTTPTSTKAAGVTISGIIYDEGDLSTQGYGWIAYGVIDASGLGVIYTSPDAATWTLRKTLVETVNLTAMAVAFPETQLGTALADFAPTYNGSQVPSTVGFARASYLTSDFGRGLVSTAIGQSILKVNLTASDATIALDTSTGGSTTNNSSSATGDATIFTLNTLPDSVRIRVASENVSGSDVGQLGVVDTVGSFTDDQFFTPLTSVDYGYNAVGSATATNNVTEDVVSAVSKMVARIEFTFRKNGYNDLTVSYFIEGKGTALASDLS